MSVHWDPLAASQDHLIASHIRAQGALFTFERERIGGSGNNLLPTSRSSSCCELSEAEWEAFLPDYGRAVMISRVEEPSPPVSSSIT
jgi:hypothetical protein